MNLRNCTKTAREYQENWWGFSDIKKISAVLAKFWYSIFYAFLFNVKNKVECRANTANIIVSCFDHSYILNINISYIKLGLILYLVCYIRLKICALWIFICKYLSIYIVFFCCCKTWWYETLILMIKGRTWKEAVNLESLNFLLLNLLNSVIDICSACSMSSVYISLPNLLVTWPGTLFIKKIPCVKHSSLSYKYFRLLKFEVVRKVLPEVSFFSSFAGDMSIENYEEQTYKQTKNLFF